MELPEWSSGIGKHLVKIGDGESVTGVFRGKMVKFFQHWNGGRPTVCVDRATCSLCASTNEDEKKSSGRFRINFMVEENGKWVAKVFEGGKRVYERLRVINADIPIESIKVRISASGKGKQKDTFIDPIHGENGILKDPAKKAMQIVPLIDLYMGAKEEETDGDVPF